MSGYSRCVHFKGIQNTCGAGIDPKTVRDESQRGPYRWPCLTLVGYQPATTACASFRAMTQEEIDAETAKLIAAADAFEAALALGKCPHCGAQIQRRKTVGRCEYAEPCGHRLGQVHTEPPHDNPSDPRSRERTHMITADQLVAHAVGDYVLQSDWMANDKTKRSFAALCHVITYAIPFLFLRPSLAALAVIAGTHFVIDRWRLARFVCFAKNFLSPRSSRVVNVTSDPWYAWKNCRATGYPSERPTWMTVWLLIIADNVMHVLINGAALRWL